MRKKLNPADKRGQQIGIKVKKETKLKLFYIAKREGEPTSTLINKILTDYTEEYLNIAHIDWKKLTPEERGEA